MIGGKLLATGSSTCVFSPSIPCSKKNSVDKNKITKIMYSSKSKESYDKEKETNNMIKNINNYKKWAVIFSEYCKAPEYNILTSYDKKGLKECTYKGINLSDFNKNSYMLTGINGGNTFVHYFKENFSTINYGKSLNNNFITLMKMMRPLFVGLCALNKNKICHNDIKYNNIVYKTKKEGFRYIDFGLSSGFKYKDNFKKRSIKEFNTSRLYIFYPLEYIYFYVSSKLLHIEKFKQRKNNDIINNIYRIFNLDFNNIKKETIHRIRNKQIDENKMIEKIDIYSLGILLPLLFIQYSNIINPHENSKVIQDFYFLFKEMCLPFSDNRITPTKALKKLDSLLKKHGTKKNKKKSKKKK